MKKLLAILLALLMLGSVTAFAEGNECFSLRDIHLVLDGEEAIDLDLAGLELRFGALGEDGLVLNIFGGEELLFRAQAEELEDDTLLLSADGLSHSYLLPLSMLGDIDAEEDEDEAVEIELDWEPLLEAVLSKLEVTPQGAGIHFVLPYEASQELLDELASQLSTVEVVQIDGLDELVAQLHESQSGIALEGNFKPGFRGFSGDLAVYLVEGGVQPEVASLALDGNLSRGKGKTDYVFNLSLYDEESDALAPVGTLTGSSVKSGDETVGSCVFSLYGEELFSLDTVSVKQEEQFDYQATLHLLGFGEEPVEFGSLVLHTGGIFHFALSFSGQGVELSYDPETQELAVNFAFGETSGSLTMLAGKVEGEVEPCGSDAENALNIPDLSDEDKATLEEELGAALEPVLNYLAPVLAPYLG